MGTKRKKKKKCNIDKSVYMYVCMYVCRCEEEKKKGRKKERKKERSGSGDLKKAGWVLLGSAGKLVGLVW